MTKRIEGAVPSLLVTDLHETLEFYGALGFTQTGRWPDEGPVTWAEVRRGEFVLWFYSDAPVGTPDEPVMSGTLYFFPDDVAALHREWQGVVDFAWGPEVMPYGMREFGIQDPDGYYLAFTEPA